MLDVVALFPPPGFMALATSALMAAFHYSRRRRYAAALSMAGLSTGLTHLHEGLGGLAADLVPVAVGIAVDAAGL
ncbi:MAG: hypothetical protein OXH32_03735 [Acidobacteria bacterium]|nr:hypothetical protein [Acidobacteriota bacterium]